MFCIRFKETRMRDGARFGDRVKPASKYNVKEMATHELIFDYLTELSNSAGKDLKVITTVGSDKSRTFAHVFERNYKSSEAEFTDNRIKYLIEEIVKLKSFYYKKHLDNIINNYKAAFDTLGISLSITDAMTYKEKQQAVNTALLNLYALHSSSDVRKKLTQAFRSNNIPFVLDYHYVEAKDSSGKSYITTKNMLFDNFSLSDDEIRNNITQTMEEDLKDLKKLVPLGSHAADLIGKLNSNAVTKNPTERMEVEGDTDEAYNRYFESSTGNSLEATYIKKDYYDNVYKQYVLERMLATRMHNDTLMGSTYFYKGASEQAMFIEKNKREAAVMSTIIPFDTNNPYGISKMGRFVAVNNPKVNIKTLTDDKSEWAYDGASYSTELHMIQMKNSLGGNMGQPSGTGSMKTIGVYHDPITETMTFKKHNDFTITHELIRNSRGTDMDYGVIQDKLFENSDISNINLSGYYSNEGYPGIMVTVKTPEMKNYERRLIKFRKNSTTGLSEAIVNGKIIQIKTLKDLYDALGGAYTYDSINKRYTVMGEKGHSASILNELIGSSVINNSDIRPNIINGFNFKESLKSSQPNLNSLDDLKSGDFVPFDVDRSHEGIQLNASKETDDKEASLPTQVLGALGLASATQEEAEKAYYYLKELVINEVELSIKDLYNPSEIDRIKEVIKKLTLNALATTNTSTLASSILVQSQIPYDNPQLLNIVTAALNSYLTSNGIRQKVFGSQFILAPPIQVYDNEKGGVQYGTPGDKYVDLDLSSFNIPSNITDPVNQMLYVMDIKSEYKITFNDGSSLIINPSITLEGIRNQLKAGISNKTITSVSINTGKARNLRSARSKFINKNTGEIIDIYDLDEGKQIREGKVSSKERSILLNKLNERLANLSKEYDIINYPGEMLAPKIWKSRFFLNDQTNLEDVTEDYYLKLLNDVNENNTLAKNIKEAYSRRLEEMREYLSETGTEYTIEQYAKDLIQSFNKATETVTTRIPLQSLASVMANKIVGFIDTAENTAMISHEHQILTGGDYDVDKTTLMSYFVDDNGIVYTPPSYDKNIPTDLSNVDKKAIINGLFDAIRDASLSHKNYVQRESGVDMGDVKNASDKARLINKRRALKEDSAISRMEARYANMDGKVNIGPEAVAIKSFSAMSSSYVQTVKDIDELIKKGQFEKAAKLAEYIAISFKHESSSPKGRVAVQTLLSDDSITTSIILANTPKEYIDTIVTALSYSKYYKEELDTPEKIKAFKEQLNQIQEIQPQVADMLGQLLNAATDNAKYLYLSDLNLNLTTTGMANAMIMMGMTIEQMSELLTNPVFKVAIDKFNGSIFQEKGDYVTLSDLLEEAIDLYKLEYNLNSVTEKAEPHRSNIEFYKNMLSYYQDLLSMGEELTTLGQILGINQGLKPTSYGTYTRIYNVNVYMEKIKEGGVIVQGKPFSFERFVLDENYRKEAVSAYEEVKKGVNILHILDMKPDTLAQLNLAVVSLKSQRVIGKKLDATIKLFEELKTQGVIKGKIKEEQFVAMFNGINNYIIDLYLNNKTITFREKQYDLSTLQGRVNLVTDVSQELILLKNNPGAAAGFLNKISKDSVKKDKIGMGLQNIAQVNFDPNPTGASHRDLIEELSMKAGIAHLDVEMLTALRIYNLLLYKDTLKRGSFSKYFENVTEVMSDYWSFEGSDAFTIDVKKQDVQNALIAQATRFGFGKILYNYYQDPEDIDYDDVPDYDGQSYSKKEKPEISTSVSKERAIVTIKRKDEDTDSFESTVIEINNPLQPLLPKSIIAAGKKKVTLTSKLKKQENESKIKLTEVLSSEKNKKAILLGLLNMNILTSEC